jgi:hypothetical protein
VNHFSNVFPQWSAYITMIIGGLREGCKSLQRVAEIIILDRILPRVKVPK